MSMIDDNNRCDEQGNYYHQTSNHGCLFCVHWSWVLGISRSIVFNRKQVSYGQLLSMFGVLPPIWSFGKILLDHQAEIKNSIRNTPAFVSDGVRFIFTGRYKWPSPQEAREANDELDYFKWSRRRWLISGCRSLFHYRALGFPNLITEFLISGCLLFCLHWTSLRMDPILRSSRFNAEQSNKSQRTS
jgi:hypothetical protein